MFEESGHGIKYSPQSKHTGANHQVYRAAEALTLICAAFLGFGLCGWCEQPCDISDCKSCPARVTESEPLNNVSYLTQGF